MDFKEDEGKPLQWVPHTNPAVLARMFQYKLKPDYQRPTRLDIEAQKAIVISKQPTCLFYEAGVTLFYVMNGNFFHLSDGYNGAVSGDVDPRFAGCARVVDGELKQGQGLCRGSHAELNALQNCTSNIRSYEDVRMMITLHPCFSCAKQIKNAGIKKVYYIWDYGREQHTTDFLQNRGVEVIQYTSPFLQEWIDKNGYDPKGLQQR